MPAKKAKRSIIVDAIQRGHLSILQAFGQELSQVFATEVLPKLDIKDTLSLAKVSKAFNAAVWNEHGVACMKDKMKVNGTQISPMLWAASVGNLSAVKALVKAGQDLDETGIFHTVNCVCCGELVQYPKQTMLQVATRCGHAEVVAFLIQA